MKQPIPEELKDEQLDAVSGGDKADVLTGIGLSTEVNQCEPSLKIALERLERLTGGQGAYNAAPGSMAERIPSSDPARKNTGLVIACGESLESK